MDGGAGHMADGAEVTSTNDLIMRLRELRGQEAEIIAEHQRCLKTALEPIERELEDVRAAMGYTPRQLK
jgi:hypothetical protein